MKIENLSQELKEKVKQLLESAPADQKADAIMQSIEMIEEAAHWPFGCTCDSKRRQNRPRCEVKTQYTGIQRKSFLSADQLCSGRRRSDF